MCGFAGFITQGSLPDNIIDVLKQMGLAIHSRGPDSSGEWLDEAHNVGFSHRRLAVIDLSPAGHQPMHSQTGRYAFTFNGEIYNHLELREALTKEGLNIDWKGHSDTETLLACFEHWGIQSTIEKSIGMFAFAVWDSVECTLTLGRDRLGEKPLYYGWQGDTLLFGSQLKALKCHPAFKAQVDRNSLALMLRHNNIPAPYSIYQGIHKLMPGHLLTIEPKGRTEQLHEYWSLKEVIKQASEKRFTGTPEQAVDALEEILKVSIKQQMAADVPLGAFLSGGIDSSAIVALMQAQSERPIKTFSIGFNEDSYNEAEHAKAVAEHLGTEHTELYVSPQDAMKEIPQIADLYDEPFSDSSQIPTYLVSKMAKEHVTVSLTGDAGDELFCGYNRYVLATKLWPKLSKLPRLLRKLIASTIRLIPINGWNRMNNILPASMKMRMLGDKMYKAAGVLAVKNVAELYQGLVSDWESPEDVVIDAKEPLTILTDPARRPVVAGEAEQMMALDTLSYLPDDILTKVDRAAMGVSLEGRIPFLNHKVVEFAWTLPNGYKLRDGISKWCLREVLYKHVPKSLIERPKMGFGIPIDSWLRGPLKSWAEQLLDEKRLKEEGFFEPQQIKTIWLEHQSGKYNWQHKLWSVLMFQLWYEKNRI